MKEREQDNITAKMTSRKGYVYKSLIKCRTILMRMKTGFARGWNRLNKESPVIKVFGIKFKQRGAGRSIS